MLTPHEGDLVEINAIIHRQEKIGTENFDPTIGWGHTLNHNKGLWQGYTQHGEGWTWFAASGDQGLLYYWCHFVKKYCSVLKVNGDVQNWIPSPHNDTEIELHETIKQPFGDDIHPVKFKNCQWKFCRYGGSQNTFRHFMGWKKPWTYKWGEYNDEDTERYDSALHLWQHTLRDVFMELSDLKYFNTSQMGQLHYVMGGKFKLNVRQRPNEIVTNLLT